MTKEIMHKIQHNEPFRYRVNNFTSLVYYKDHIFRDRWWIKVEFDSINNVRYHMGHRFINSRNIDGIRLEVELAIKDFLNYVTTVEVSNLMNGYTGANGGFKE